MKESPSHARWITLVIVAMGLLLVTLDNTILYTALPTLVRKLGANHSESLWIINAYPLVMAGLLIGSGSLGDRFGHRKLFLTGLLIFGIASLMAAFSPNPAILIASRAFLATGAAAMMPATLALLRLTFHKPREFHLAVAIWGSVAIIGASLGPVVSGLLLNHFWWGSVFLINVPIVMIAIVCTLLYVPKDKENPDRPWDLISALQFMAGLMGMVLLIKEIFKADPSGSVIAGSAIAAFVGLYLFIHRQRTSAHPLIEFSIFRIPALLAGVIGAFVSVFALAGLQLITSQRFQLIAEMTPLEAGLIMVMLAAGALITSILGGAIVHRTGFRPLISGGMLIAAVGVGVLIWGFPSVQAVSASLFITGMGLGMVMAVASSAIVGSVSSDIAGVASSVEEVAYEMGSLLAVSVIGSLVVSVYASVLQLPAGTPSAAKTDIEEVLRIAATLPDRQPLFAAVAGAYDHAYIVAATVIGVMLVLAAAGTFWLMRKGRA